MVKIITENKRVFSQFRILEKFESGVVLTGEEVRAIREGRVDLKGSFVKIFSGEAWLVNCYIKSQEPDRSRKLLLHKKEINRLFGRTQQRGLSLVPLRLYLKNNRVKLELALVQGLKSYDKRDKIKRKETEREIRQGFEEG